MIKHLVKHGNSAALIIEKPILELLKIKLDTPLEISTDGKNIIISPQKGEKGEERVFESLVKINKNYKKNPEKIIRLKMSSNFRHY